MHDALSRVLRPRVHWTLHPWPPPAPHDSRPVLGSPGAVSPPSCSGSSWDRLLPRPHPQRLTSLLSRCSLHHTPQSLRPAVLVTWLWPRSCGHGSALAAQAMDLVLCLDTRVQSWGRTWEPPAAASVSAGLGGPLPGASSLPGVRLRPMASQCPRPGPDPLCGGGTPYPHEGPGGPIYACTVVYRSPVSQYSLSTTVYRRWLSQGPAPPRTGRKRPREPRPPPEPAGGHGESHPEPRLRWFLWRPGQLGAQRAGVSSGSPRLRAVGPSAAFRTAARDNPCCLVAGAQEPPQGVRQGACLEGRGGADGPVRPRPRDLPSAVTSSCSPLTPSR